MKRLLLGFIFIFISHISSAQTYGNEWINYNQRYYTFKIAQDGVYRIDYNMLLNAGLPMSDFTGANMQVFGREQEVPIHIVDGGDNVFGPGDYFLFYAKRNDTWLDSLLYEDPNTIGNPYYSLYSDTIHYFFTWNNQTNNKRFVVENDINYSNYGASQYWMYEVIQNFNNMYNQGSNRDFAGNSSSKFTAGEGWTSGHANGATAGHSFFLNPVTNSPYTASGAPLCRFRGISVSNSNAALVGGNPNNHHFNWKIGSSNLILHDESFAGFQQKNITQTFPVTILNSGTTPLSYNIIPDLGVATDLQSVTAFSIKYPKQTTLNGLNRDRFYILNNGSSPNGKVRLDITGAGITNPVMLAFGNQAKWIVPTNNAGTWQALISNTTGSIEQEVVFQDASLIIPISNISPVSPSAFFRNFPAINSNKAVILIYHPNLQQAASQYAGYRSGDGGFHNVIFADVTELYLQYGGGVPKHILGIRRFSHHMHNIAQVEKPIALFLIGKGIREANESDALSGAGARKNLAAYNLNLIPSFGYPSSDMLITAGLEGTFNEPLIPVGRLSVLSNIEVLNYLNKIKAYELQQDQFSLYDSENKDWQKQILHFSGGANLSQQNSYFSSMNGMKVIIEDSIFAGNVTTYRKTSSDPLDPTQVAGLRDKLKNGVSIMNFLAHSTAQGFEINVDDPSQWENTGKYPLVIGNGCYSGDLFQPFQTTSERFVNIQNLGAIGFISTVRIGWDNNLAEYTNQLYKNFSYLKYGEYVSHQMKNTISHLQTLLTSGATESDVRRINTMNQMLLHGDPMIRVNWHTKPEIEITEQSVSFLPSDINLTTDSIELQLVIKNLGTSINTPVAIEIRRDFPFTTVDSVYSLSIPELHYTDTVRFKMPLQANISSGLNNFSITVDIPSEHPEQFDEVFNNQITKQLLIKIDGIVPVYPYEFAVVPRDSVAVKGSTINPVADFRTYRFELDTTDLFNSPQKRVAQISGLGGVKTVTPDLWRNPSNNQPFPLVCADSMVYFWRCAVDSSVLQWRESSFQYIEGKEGWGQDHYFQFKKNGFSNVKYDRPNLQRTFDTIARELKCNVYDNALVNATIFATEFFIDNQSQEYGFCQITPSIHVAVIDPVTLQPWLTRHSSNPPSLTHFYGNVNDNGSCRNRSERYFIFRQNSAAQLASFQSMIDAVPDGFYILVYTARFAEYNNWDTFGSQLNETMYETFQNLGSDSIVPGRANRSFIFFTQKGDPSEAREVFAYTPGELITMSGELKSQKTKGLEVSPLIGPAAEWKTLYWKQDPSENPTADTTRLLIKLFDQFGTYQQELSYQFTEKDSILNINNIIPAAQFPYIQLGADYTDTIGLTPAQVDRWHILYQPVPEAAIDGSTAYTWLPMSDTLDEGQDLKFAVDIRNISDYPMDSMLVKYWIQDANQVKHVIPYQRQDSLRVGGVIRDTIAFSTVGYGGINSLWMEVNPYVNGSSFIKDQPEQYHFNNLLQIPFYVRGDDLNPILDVTFDGRHILNGDIVNPFSEISISLKDDNPYLVMNADSDTTLFGIYLTSPDGLQKRIPFMDGNGNVIMQWIPAEAQHKRFKIIYPAAFDQDGIYTLTVQGSDRTGNLSGDLDYKITFEVIHESSITYLMNYPNPFSTSTRFVFTLTGSEVPDEMIIQIMTVTGKVVREITEDELGPIHIGRNVTSYAWDGTDEFGDRLANGVYLYRVLSEINGEEIKQRSSGADQYFKKEFGKMYLMR